MILAMYDNQFLRDSILILATESASSAELRSVKAVLEDVQSPVTTKYMETLFDKVIEKGHVDFGDIPTSKGNIENYKGYQNMVEILDVIAKLASDRKESNVFSYVNIVRNAITNMKMLSSYYEKAFRLKNEYLQIEYNTLVYTIVQAVSTILYEFVDYVKRPDEVTFTITLKNTKYRANAFYFDQLSKFNNINSKMKYKAYLEAILSGDGKNFTGEFVVGVAVVTAVALAAIPVLRSLVYHFYNVKADLSDCLAQQAYFLEINKASVESNQSFDQKKKDKILMKQEKVKNLCLRLSEKLRVNHINAIKSGEAAVSADNKLLTLDSIKSEVSNSPLQLL